MKEEALKLADYVDFLDSELSYGYEVTGADLDKVAIMLRQQAKRIEDLENPIMQAIGIAFAKPQTWQYLTDDEIKEIIGGYGNEGGIGSYTRELFDKIEAKIREKNENTSGRL